MSKEYQHFDYNLTEKAAIRFENEIVHNKSRVAQYRFFPFIMFNIEQKVYHRTKGHLRAHLKIKKRPISLTAHHDALIYSYYAEKLTCKYEAYLHKYRGLYSVPTAYRKELKSSNINSAKEVFDFIVDSENCLIIKGDFKGFFDNLRHKILIRNLCKVLNTDKLPKDWESIIKSLTKYRFTYYKDIIKAQNRLGIKHNSDKAYAKNRKEIGLFIKKGGLKIHGPNQLGIPQGTSLSAVLANIYMIDFDKNIYNYVNSKDGLYRRYSDDFIIIIPNKTNNEDQQTIFKYVREQSERYTKLTVEEHKTKNYVYNKNKEHKIKSLDCKDSPLDYLGFTFDGDIVRMRDKSIYKFHYKSKKAINSLISKRKYFLMIDKDCIDDYKHTRRVWKKGEHKYEKVYSVKKQTILLNRIHRLKKIIPITKSKMVTKMYLSNTRYGHHSSMIDYANRAQRIFEKNDEYKTEISKTISKQIYKNQKSIHDAKLRLKRMRDN